MLKKAHRLYRWMLGAFVGKKELGGFGENSVVECPTYIENPQSVFLAENARIRRNVTIINSPAEKVKKIFSHCRRCHDYNKQP